MTEDAWANDPRFSKSTAVPEFAGLRETVEKSAGFVAGIESTPEQVSSGADTPSHGSGEASYSQQQVDDLVAAARAEGAAEAQAQADQQIEQVRAENLATLQGEFTEFMHALRSDVGQRQPLFQPLRDLALALAEHLARVEMSQSDTAIDAVINAVINDLDPTDLGQIEIHVSEAWAERLKGQPLQGVADGYPVVADEGLSDGDVRLVVNDAQVEDLIADRIQQLAQQMDNADFSDVVEPVGFAEVGLDPVEATPPEVSQFSANSEPGLADTADVEDAEFQELPATDPEPDED
jgi:flagellar biosynthesis/type III secretory pathway protein FliH